MLKYLSYLVAAFAAFFLVLWLGTTRPEAINQFLIKVDVLGWTQAGAVERQRIAKIMTLPVAYEKRQALANHTVFMGASKNMVSLALGLPKDRRTYPGINPENVIETWLYYIVGDTKPTLLIFENDKLVEARQVSTLNVLNDLSPSPSSLREQ